MRLIAALLVAACSTPSTVPHRALGVGAVDLAKVPACVEGRLRTGEAVVVCTERPKTCAEIAGGLRRHGDSWWIPRGLRLAALDRCGDNPLKPLRLEGAP